VSLRLQITSDEVERTPTPWELDLYDQAFSSSPLLINAFATLEEANQTASLLQTCTNQTCTIKKVPCVSPLPWRPCPPTYMLHEHTHNITLAEINVRAVEKDAATVAARAISDATAPISVERYCVCPKAGGQPGEIRFWQCTEVEFNFCVKHNSEKCPPF